MLLYRSYLAPISIIVLFLSRSLYLSYNDPHNTPILPLALLQYQPSSRSNINPRPAPISTIVSLLYQPSSRSYIDSRLVPISTIVSLQYQPSSRSNIDPRLAPISILVLYMYKTDWNRFCVKLMHLLNHIYSAYSRTLYNLRCKYIFLIDTE